MALIQFADDLVRVDEAWDFHFAPLQVRPRLSKDQQAPMVLELVDDAAKHGFPFRVFGCDAGDVLEIKPTVETVLRRGVLPLLLARDGLVVPIIFPQRAGAIERHASVGEFLEAVFYIGSFGIESRRHGDAERKDFASVDEQHVVGIDGDDIAGGSFGSEKVARKQNEREGKNAHSPRKNNRHNRDNELERGDKSNLKHVTETNRVKDPDTVKP